MNYDDEKMLELEIDRELKALPELSAPSGFSKQVLARIRQRKMAPWYHQSWQYWPNPLRWFAIVFLSLLFSTLCVVSWRLTRAAGMSAALQEVGDLFSGLNTVWNILSVLLGTLVLVAKSLGTGFIIACFAVAGLGYAVCLTVGAAWVRLASAHRS